MYRVSLCLIIDHQVGLQERQSNSVSCIVSDNDNDNNNDNDVCNIETYQSAAVVIHRDGHYN